jgi:hypothetical protein
MRDFRYLKVWQKAYALTPSDVLLLARDSGYLDEKDYLCLAVDVTEVKRMLTSFIQKLTAEG